ncbi:surfeit locus 1 family protein [Phyllobacterium ifriqiyense]|uniref:SURF1-like protein n=1 Tax=Phyllobacterium ifriqiyense TaxID=314238 RepID=A0ABU0S4M2_9HYPH|nr:SURF1 family protein [Phyllobacterium ifriqiyense]MDQ0995697.1 surfeit locus 1 family protein [Phyllobacterium ifriqiyense]
MKKALAARGLAASGERVGETDNSREDDRRLPSIKLALIGGLVLFCIIVLTSLGIWQLQRRVWKLDLINQVEQRVNAPATAAPGPDIWAGINAKDFAYRHVTTSGKFLDKPAALVQAVTARGSGFWVLSPFQSTDGFTVFINRGFVPTDKARDEWRADHLPPITITGLLRLTEPKGGFLRNNDPVGDRWYSRDVMAMAAAHNIGPVAPYFIDADANPDPNALPIGGLTVISFANNHLVYALTWFGMALLLGAASAIIGRNEWRARQRPKYRSG